MEMRKLSFSAPGKPRRLSMHLLAANSSFLNHFRHTTKDGDVRDPRPIRDKVFMATARTRIAEFLMSSGYVHPLNTKTLTSPTKKDFEFIFRFLYSLVDPLYPYGKKLEDDVTLILRQYLKYPFVDKISKSSIHAVGSVQSWPVLLAMLSWIAELLTIAEKINVEDDYELTDDSLANPSNMYPYLVKAYNLLLVGESGEKVVQEVLSMIEQKKDSEVAKNDSRQETLTNLAAQLSELQAMESPISFLLRESEKEDAETQNIEETLAKQGRDRLAAQKEIDDLQREFQELDMAIAAAKQESRDLDTLLDRQEIGHREALALANERESLCNSIQERQERKKELTDALRIRESSVAKARANFERHYAEYKSLIRDLGLSLNIAYDPTCGTTSPSEVAPRAAVRPALLRERSERLTVNREMADAAARAQQRVNAFEEELRDFELTAGQDEEMLEALASEFRLLKSFYEEDSVKITRENTEMDQETQLMLENSRRELSLCEKRTHRKKTELEHVKHDADTQLSIIASYSQRMADEIASIVAHVSMSIKTLGEITDSELKSKSSEV